MSKMMQALADYLHKDAERLSGLLRREDWKPSRSHIEGARNTMISAANSVLHLTRAPSRTEEIAEHLYTKFCADPSIEWQDAPEKLKEVWCRYASEIAALSGEEGKSE